MKIKYKKSNIFNNLLLAIFWFGIAIFYWVVKRFEPLILFLHLIPISNFIYRYLYKKENQYLTIEDGVIQKNNLYSSNTKIQVNEISEIEKIGLDYLLKSEDINLRFDPNLIDEESLKELTQFLGQLNLPSENNLYSKLNTGLKV
ncbi:GspE family protein [Psychroflexus lacisalsi]|jgi:hypothetical protein|uniref:PH domain-containing protein n=1 Tax=Psychroflexus lacisalsi TaxID=503928 RepID=A0ABN1KDI9_9FLAO|nr:GspE family protein [Psychroflexus lacisalsi]MBZ9620238.1 GspE family protein [Psychroflexus lacisalsi]